MKLHQKLTLSVLMLSAGCVLASAQSNNAGVVNFAMRTSSQFDTYTNNPSNSTKSWLNQRFWWMQTSSPYFDSRVGWFPKAWAYVDLYAIHVGSDLAKQHPDWILKDENGSRMFIPYACSGGMCSQYAADPGNAGFRQYKINAISAILAKGYKGIWLDDVNLQFQVSNGDGQTQPPIDPRTHQSMSYTQWKAYIAGFASQIRNALPNAKILHNNIWFAGGPQRDADPSVIKEIQAADYINCERGVNDPGLTGGDGNWSVNAFLAFVDRVHSRGKHVIFDEYNQNGEYGLAGYFLISNGGDGIGNHETTPNNWWKGYEANLGSAKGNRYSWKGLLRRDFTDGMVLLSVPGTPTTTVQLPETYRRIDGSITNQVTLRAGQAAIMMNPNIVLP
jgi:hypothetical protein